MSSKVIEPYELYLDVGGDPLDAGSIYIGTAGLDAKTNQVQAYFDSDLNIPAAQPINTINGRASNGGTPTNLYVSANDYSLKSENKNGVVILDVLRKATSGNFTGSITVAEVTDLTNIDETLYNTAIVSDAIRGGIFEYDATQSAVDNSGTIFDGWVRQYDGVLNVQWFDAKGDGVTDDTTAFADAIAASGNSHIWVPKTSSEYIVNDLELPAETFIEGEGFQANAPKFNSSTSTRVFKVTSGAARIYLKNLCCTSGQTAFFEHLDRTNYVSYSRFEGIETYGSMDYAFKGFFIFCQWENCRDGFLGSSDPAHQFIVAIPSDDHINGLITQSNTTNLNTVTDCYMFAGGASSPAVIEIEYGYQWKITGCDFEGIDITAISARGARNLVVEGNWCEGVSTLELIRADSSRGLNSHGTNLICKNNNWNVTDVTVNIVNIRNASNCVFDNNYVQGLQSGVVFDGGQSGGFTGILSCENNNFATSDPTAVATFVRNPEAVEIFTTTMTPETSGSFTLATNADSFAHTINYAENRVYVNGEITVAILSTPLGAYFTIALPEVCGDLTDNAGRVSATCSWFDNSTGGYSVLPMTIDEGDSVAKVYLDPSLIQTSDRFGFSFNYPRDF